MSDESGRPEVSALVLEQADQIAGKTIWQLTLAALWRASGCRCWRCRAQAGRTVTWAAAMLPALLAPPDIWPTGDG